MRRLLVILVAVLIGVACALPNILGYLELGQRYEPFTHFFFSDIQVDETCWYGPSASYFKETLSIPFEADIFEYRGIPNLKYLLPIFIDGGIGYVFKSLRHGRSFMHFFFPAISFLLVYLLARRLSSDAIVSLFSAVIFCTLGYGPRTLLNICQRNIYQPVLFSRLTSPAATLPFLIIALIGLMKICSGESKKGVVLSGVFGGLLFYTYYFYQVAYITMLILLIFIYLVNKQRETASRLFLSGVISNIVGVLWYIQFYYAVKLSPGVVSRYVPPLYIIRIKPSDIIIPLFYAVVILIVYILQVHKDKSGECRPSRFLKSDYLPLYILCVSCIVLAGFVSPFIMPLIQPWHFIQHIVNGFSFLLASSVIAERLVLKGRIYRLTIAIGIIAIISLLYIKQWNRWQYTKDYFVSEIPQQTAERLIHEHTDSRDVIGIKDPYLNSIFPARLWRFRFYAGYYGLTNVKWRENVCRYLFIQKMFNKPWEDIHKIIIAEEKKEDKKSGFSISVPYLLSLNPTFRHIEKEEMFERIYESLDKTFIDMKKLDFILCLGDKEEEEMLLGTRKMDIRTTLEVKEGTISLYRVVK